MVEVSAKPKESFITVRVPTEVKKRLRMQAIQQDETLQALVNRALALFLDGERP